MTPEPAIEVHQASVAFDLPHYGTDSIKEFAIRRLKRHYDLQRILAVDGLTLTVSAGEVLGVVGANGAGKSTLLRLIAGVLKPTSGRVVVRGAVTPILGLGTGFHGDMTGDENAVMLGALLGRAPAVMKERVAGIADWAGLTAYRDVPLRAFSAGMQARLAFAVVADLEPDVLLLDEVLSVGDVDFQERSRSRLEDMLSGGTTAVLVSHDLSIMRDWCTRALWIDGGRGVELGEPERVIEAYLSGRRAP